MKLAPVANVHIHYPVITNASWLSNGAVAVRIGEVAALIFRDIDELDAFIADLGEHRAGLDDGATP